MAKTSPHNLVEEVNALSDSINQILNENEKARYFEGIALLQGFIEDLLKWLVFTQIIWNKSQKGAMPNGEAEELRKFCNQQNLYQTLRAGLICELLEFPLFTELDELRQERNQIVHQYWLYTHTGDLDVLRKKLERLASATSTLVGKLNVLIEETGMDESMGFFAVQPGKNFVAL